MTKVIITFTLFICSLLSVKAQSQYEQGMQKAFSLWGEGKSKDASDMFERIASAEKDNWLPNYYVALVNTTASFQTKDKEIINAMLTKAQSALDKELAKAPQNAELIVMQAMIYTAWLVSDPMTNGRTYSIKVMGEYAKAEAIAPNNPRVVFGKADFEINSAKYFGTDTTEMCKRVEKSIALFDAEKLQTPFHPHWGKDRAVVTLSQCKK